MAEPSPNLKVPLYASVEHLEEWARHAGIPVVPVCRGRCRPNPLTEL